MKARAAPDYVTSRSARRPRFLSGPGRDARPAEARGSLRAGGVVLIAAGIAAMSARRLFAEYRTYVVSFPMPWAACARGAVTFRRSRSASDAGTSSSTADLRRLRIMAVVEVRERAARPQRQAADHRRELARIMIESGLRASVVLGMIAGTALRGPRPAPEAARCPGSARPTPRYRRAHRMEVSTRGRGHAQEDLRRAHDEVLSSSINARELAEGARHGESGDVAPIDAARRRGATFASAEKALGQWTGERPGPGHLASSTNDEGIRDLDGWTDARPAASVEGTGSSRSETLKTVERGTS